MNKTASILIIVSILIVVGIAGFALSQKFTSNQDSSMKKEEVAKHKDGNSLDNSATSRYVEYSKTAYDNATDKRRVLFFYASWCPICQPVDAEFKTNSGKIPEDVKLFRVHYSDPQTNEAEKGLAKQYGITYQHTFVQVDKNGSEAAKWNGGGLSSLLGNLK